MPIYEYCCDRCGLQFEVLKGLSQRENEQLCPECQVPARPLVSPVNHSFAHRPAGPVPQNTGVHQIDYSVDRVIGRDAEAKWKLIEERQKYKRGKIREIAKEQQVIAKMDHLVRTREGAGDYRMITEKERQDVNAKRELAFGVLKAGSKPSE